MNRDDIALLLPAVFRVTRSPGPEADRNLLSAVLAVMERQHAPDPDLLVELGLYEPDPAKALTADQERYLAWLSGAGGPAIAGEPSPAQEGDPLPPGSTPGADPPRYLGWDYLFDRLEIFYEPERTAARFLPYLASWLGLENLLLALLAKTHPGWASLHLLSRPLRWQEVMRWLRDPQACPLDVQRLRQLVIAAPELIRLRGTSLGLERYLEIATGLPGQFKVENTGQPFHIRVKTPPLTALQAILVGQIIELEKPAYVTYEPEPKFAAGVER